MGNQLNIPLEWVDGVMPWDKRHLFELDKAEAREVIQTELTYVDIFEEMAVKVSADSVNGRIVLGSEIDRLVSVVVDWNWETSSRLVWIEG